jgi:16S rRNA (guanine527-N7)-methyltransferase
MDIKEIFYQGGIENVSDEAFLKLKTYENLLKKWQKTINLVGNSTVNSAFERHFLDSARLLNHIPDMNIKLVDMGSGAGFPGMVLAILGVKDVHLIESDSRKAAFLQNVSRETNTPLTLYNNRIEDCKIPDIDIITARALAPLGNLLGYMIKLEGKNGLFHKGAQYEAEILEAREKWEFSAEIYPASTGKIIRISNLAAK